MYLGTYKWRNNWNTEYFNTRHVNIRSKCHSELTIQLCTKMNKLIFMNFVLPNLTDKCKYFLNF